jgi:hypothetical protein
MGHFQVPVMKEHCTTKDNMTYAVLILWSTLMKAFNLLDDGVGKHQ